MTGYLDKRDDAALDLLIHRLEAVEKRNDQQAEMLVSAKRILAARSAAKVGPVFDIPRAIAFLSAIAQKGRLCSYKDLAEACLNDPSAHWNTYYRKIGGPRGLMQSIIRHCAANGLPHLSSLVVRQNEVKAGPGVVPDREGEAEYGFKRGMVDEGLVDRGVDTDKMVLEAREGCFIWARSLGV